jgi:hypothetical protein
MIENNALEQLQSRRAWLGGKISLAIRWTLILIAGFILVLQPGAFDGPVDVHILDNLADKLVPRWSTGGNGVWIVGGFIGTVQHWIGIAVQSFGFLAIPFTIGSLIFRKKKAAKFGVFLFLAAMLLHTVSPTTQVWAPKAVSTATARQLLDMPASGWPADAASAVPGQRYVMAQIAFIEGDPARAARYSADLRGSLLGSPIEAPFRLQFLQGRPNIMSTVCKISGCMKESVRFPLSIFMGLASLIAIALVIGAIHARFTLKSQIGQATNLIKSLDRVNPSVT